MVMYNGACHCGKVTWEIDIPDERHIVCHCRACSVMGGGEYSMNQLVQRKDLQITKGEVGKYTYTGDSGQPVDVFFCATCTSVPYLHAHSRGQDTLIIRTALLKGSETWGKPVADLYCQDKASWQPVLADLSFQRLA